MFQDVLNTYCWIHSTYTIPSAFWKRIGFDVAHPGVDKTQVGQRQRQEKDMDKDKNKDKEKDNDMDKNKDKNKNKNEIIE